MKEKHKHILSLALMYVCAFLAINWIYGRTQLSGWIPVPFSIMLLVGSVSQSYRLIGALLEPSESVRRQLIVTMAYILIVLSTSALAISILTQVPVLISTADENVQLPLEGTPATMKVEIYVGNDDYRFVADGSTVTDLAVLVARCQDLVSNKHERQMLLRSESNVSYARIAEVLDALRAVGLTNIGVATGSK